MTKICYEISMYESSILDWIELGKKIGFIPGGSEEKTRCINQLRSLGLIDVDDKTPSGWSITDAGRAVCSMLFVEKPMQAQPATLESERDPRNGNRPRPFAVLPPSPEDDI